MHDATSRADAAAVVAGWGVTDLVALAGDASTRRYLRGRDASGRSVVVMDCGGSVPEESGGFDAFPFTRWQRRYREIGIRVPGVLALDRACGVVLLEDLGDELLQRRVETLGAARCADLYARAVHWGRLLAGASFPEDPDEDPLVPARLALEMDLLLAHLARLPLPQGLPALQQAARALDRSRDPALSRARRLLHALCDDVHAAGSMTPCHRDFHARNLILCDGDLAVIDFQDTRRGPRAYDLASLAWDPYVALPEPMIERLVAAWRPRGADEASWDREVRLAGGQRLLKAAGSYAYLSRGCGRPQYAQWLPPALARAKERLSAWEPAGEAFLLLEAVRTP